MCLISVSYLVKVAEKFVVGGVVPIMSSFALSLSSSWVMTTVLICIQRQIVVKPTDFRTLYLPVSFLQDLSLCGMVDSFVYIPLMLLKMRLSS